MSFFELDAKYIVNPFHSNRLDLSEFGLIIQDCQFFCHQGSQFSIYFTRRKANGVAHTLAWASCNLVCPFFFSIPPICLEDPLLT